jgi:hypothetical protein
MTNSERIASYIRKADACQLRSSEAESVAAKHEWRELANEWHWMATHIELLDKSGGDIAIVSNVRDTDAG